MTEILETSSQVVLSVRMKGDATGPQTGDVVLAGNIFQDFSEEEIYEPFEAVIKDGDIYRAKDLVNPGPWNPEDWECVTNITIVVGDFIPNHSYNKGEVILHEGHLYRAPEDMTTGNSWDYAEWEAIDSVNTIIDSFEARSDYSLHEAVVHDGKLYRAKRQFISTSTFRLSDWELISDIIVDTFQTNTDYAEGNVVIIGGMLARANHEFTSGTTFDPADWDIINSAGIGEFKSNTFYSRGSAIYVNGKIYIAKDDFTSQTTFNPNDWDVASETVAANYNNNTIYVKDQIIYKDGRLYRAKANFTSAASWDPSDWELLASSITNGFEPNTPYLEGTIIHHDGVLWIARRNFTSGTSFDPTDWIILTQTEQETYDSWMGTGTAVDLSGDMVEKFRSQHGNTELWNTVNDSKAQVQVQEGNRYANITAVDDTEAYMKVHNNSTSADGTIGEGILSIRGTTATGGEKLEIKATDKTVSFTTNLKNSFSNALSNPTTSQKGTVTIDDDTIRADGSKISSYPVIKEYASGHKYSRYELCTYKNNLYIARASFTAGNWNIAQWYPAKEIARPYAVNQAYSVGDLIIVNDQLYYCNSEITSAPASREAADWTVLETAASNVVLNTQGNEIATSANLETSINYLDSTLSTAVMPEDDETRYLIKVQTAGSTPPTAIPGKTIICFYTE